LAQKTTCFFLIRFINANANYIVGNIVVVLGSPALPTTIELNNYVRCYMQVATDYWVLMPHVNTIGSVDRDQLKSIVFLDTILEDATIAPHITFEADQL